MKPRRLGVRSFISYYDETVRRTRASIADCGEDPSPERIHASRASIRRLDAAVQLLPRGFTREKETARYLELIDRFSVASARASDCDVVGRMLSSASWGDGAGSAASDLSHERLSAARKSARLAKRIAALPTPLLEPEEVSGKKLQKRFDERVKRLEKRINEAYPLVVSEEREVALLHKMRRDVRRLRHLLTLADDARSETDVVSRLIELQDLLGAVRDIDVALKKVGTSPALRARLVQARKGAYETFRTRSREMGGRDRLVETR